MKTLTPDQLTDLKKDIKYLKRVLDNNKDEINEVLQHIDKVGIGSAEYWCTDVDESTKNLPDYVTINYADVWENKLSKDYFEIDCDGYEYTYGHIFRKKLNIFKKDS